jgi:Leucine-rich repeat (LRR) protein
MEFVSNNMSSIEGLIAIIENSNNTEKRLESIRNLSGVLGKNDKMFKLLEHLLISDSDVEIRCLAAESLRKNFSEKLFEPMMWSIQHESSIRCLKIVFKSLLFYMENLELSDQNSKLKLIEHINTFNDSEFKIAIKNFSENKSVQETHVTELIEIIYNYVSLSFLKKKFWRIKYKIEGLNVVELDFIFKGLTEIPKPIKYLKSIKKLSFKYNQISKLPDWCGNLTSLQQVDLSQNQLSSLPESIKHLYKLKILNLEGNDFTLLPESLFSLHSLEILNIKSNSIEHIPNKLTSLNCLRELHVGAYSLVEIPDDVKEMEKKGLKIYYESI